MIKLYIYILYMEAAPEGRGFFGTATVSVFHKFIYLKC